MLSQEADISSLVARYAGRELELARAGVVGQNSQKSKLGELASSLAHSQNENDALRRSCASSEEKRRKLMQANDAANATCDKLRDQIADAVDAKQAVEAQNAPLHEEAAALRKELEESEEALREERSQGCAREMEIERLSRECATLDVEGRKLRDDWDDKVSMLTAAEQERDYWHTALHALAGQYSDGFARLEAMNVNPNHFAMRRSPIQQGDWAVSSGSASPRPAFSPTTATASISPAPRIHGW